ncbi:MAG: tyrosine-type recombinase/integrase [Lachnospiraceae bacterium]
MRRERHALFFIYIKRCNRFKMSPGYKIEAAAYLELDNIGTHSFRKFYATDIYVENNYNIVLVQHLLQHSSSAITQRYIGIQQKEIEDAIEKHINLL